MLEQRTVDDFGKVPADGIHDEIQDILLENHMGLHGPIVPKQSQCCKRGSSPDEPEGNSRSGSGEQSERNPDFQPVAEVA